MGFLEAIARNSFKTAKDGRQLFFPWGPIGWGYIIPSETEYQKLLKKVKISYVGIFIYIIVVPLFFSWLKVLSGAILLGIVPYSLWAYSQCRHLERTTERLTLIENIYQQARLMSFFVLWLLEMVTIAFVIAGIFIIIVDWRNWLIGSASIVFFGFCAVIGARMLLVKRRQRNGS